MDFLTTSPTWVAALLLVGVLTLAAMAGPILVRRRWALERLKTNNEVAGFKFATVGVLYAVLLAFAVIVVWEKFTEADDRVAAEAGAAATIYRLADGMGGVPGAELRAAITAYLRGAVDEDWAAMERGGASRAATAALDAVYATLLRFEPADARGEVVMAEVLLPARPADPGAARADRPGLGRRAGDRVGGALLRSVGDDRVHLLLRDREPAWRRR